MSSLSQSNAQADKPAVKLSAITSLTKAAGDPLRTQILKALQQNAYGVLELCQIFDIRQSAMSHHLKLLANASLVAKRREGTTIFYRRNLHNVDEDLQSLQQILFASIDKADLDKAVQERLQQIHTERAEASVEFFNRNLSRFAENQDLIASWSDYGDSVESFLDSSIGARATAIEIGPGYGQFLNKLSETFERVVALDNSRDMLEQSQITAQQQSLSNIEFILGDTKLAIQRGIKADCLALNMVLHHNASPAEIIADCANLLGPQGVLLITDLCAHDQEWVKDSCGDFWLGFEPEELTYWANVAGLVEGNSLYLTQRNGFRIQLRQFSAESTAN